MILSIFAYSRQGCRTAEKIIDFFLRETVQAYTMEKFQIPGFKPIPRPSAELYREKFSSDDALIFVGSCGIAVRQIAPYVKDKKTDPAVLCVDELGKYVIPLLSGHIGGANALAVRLGEKLNALPVVTTATDINGKFSVDAWAARNGFIISSMQLAKEVSAGILEEKIPIFSRFPVKGDYPKGTVSSESGALGVALTWKKESPFHKTLRLIPRVLHLGIGCRKGTGKEAIAAAVDQVLKEYAIDPRAICCAASIDLKAQEQGLLDYCSENGIPITFYTAGELNAVPGEYTPSAFVSSVTGVDNVCERSAMVGADRMIVRKTACNGVTVAVAEEYREVYFG